MPAETTVNTTDGAITFETADDARISPGGVSYLAASKGQPVLLLHAFPLSSAMWRAQIRALQGDYHVIAPDMRGFGSTPAFPATPSVDQMGDDAAALLRGRLEVSVFGVSGASVAGFRRGGQAT
jgi:pimeloyl-ACP methyl ester carboxylesterase